MQAPPGLALHLLSLSTGTEEELSQGSPSQTFTLADDGHLTDASGVIAQVRRNHADSIWVLLPQLHQTLPAEQAIQTYHRITPQGAEVMVGEDGDLITEAAYGLLNESERGAILFLRQPPMAWQRSLAAPSTMTCPQPNKGRFAISANCAAAGPIAF